MWSILLIISLKKMYDKKQQLSKSFQDNKRGDDK